MLKFLSVLGDVVGRFLRWWDERQAIAKGREIERVAAAETVKEAAHEADQIRADVRAAISAEPERLRDDDGFKRPD